MEIDIMAVLYLVWSCCIGWKRRGLNAVMDFMAFSIVAIVVKDIIPSTEHFVIQPELQIRLLEWIQYHINETTPVSATFFHIVREIPVGSNMFNRDLEIWNKSYNYVMTSITGIAFFISIQMIRRSLITVWPPRSGMWDSKLTGAMIYGILGIAAWMFSISCLSLLTWFHGFAWLDHSLQQSLFVRTSFSLNPW
ncbi:hypothetical protein LSG31_05695 [Fodinisporobacter ferrooxydans]|uniref:Colicin V production protein n=1 Tax=Fodinisporobacter ferrooxydans TaxID=2901836 RepID=A0ABY4CMM3_9BACL|nr:hypothetical protein LSG31_05695 [Alicyclobacillaceae bacterium MYW30-H2]